MRISIKPSLLIARLLFLMFGASLVAPFLYALFSWSGIFEENKKASDIPEPGFLRYFLNSGLTYLNGLTPSFRDGEPFGNSGFRRAEDWVHSAKYSLTLSVREGRRPYEHQIGFPFLQLPLSLKIWLLDHVEGSGLYDAVGVPEGQWVIKIDAKWGSDHKVLAEGLFRNGQRHGIWKERLYPDFPDIYRYGAYVNGIAEGIWKAEYDNGQLLGTLKFIGGKAEGPWNGYYKSGELRDSGMYKEGRPEGLWLIYYENGQIRQRGEVTRGYRHGPWESYRSNGMLYAKACFDKGFARSGIEFDADGEISGIIRQRQHYWSYPPVCMPEFR